MFTFKCGYYGVNTTPPSIQDTSSFAIDYVLRVSGDKLLIPTDTSIVMTGPGNGAYSDIQQSYYATGQDCFIAFFHRQSKLPFGDGVYTMTLDSKKYSLEYSNINAKYFLVLAEPTIHTDGNGRVTSITVQYKDLKGNGIIAENFVYQTQVTLNKGTKQLCQIGALWEGPEAKTNTELYTFVPKDSINIADVTSAQVTYLDLIGNAYNNCY
jgi:hypothetical protein